MENPQSKDPLNSVLKDAQMSHKLQAHAKLESTKLVGNLLANIGYGLGVIAPIINMISQGSGAPFLLFLVPVFGTIIPSIWFNSSGNLSGKVIAVVLALMTQSVITAGLGPNGLWYWIIPVSLFTGFWINQRKVPEMEKEIN